MSAILTDNSLIEENYRSMYETIKTIFDTIEDLDTNDPVIAGIKMLTHATLKSLE